MLNKKTILVAEDDKFYANIYKTKLVKEGYDVLLAGNGEEALNLLKTSKPDLILLDLVMPIKDGFDTLSEIKSNESLKKIKVLVLSNLGQEEDKEKASSLGADGYVVKSNLSIDEMLEKIKSYLN